MAEEYAFPVLVELEESDTPRLKNKLVKYFQSRKSNGGDCEVDYESGSQTALLRFRREEDQKNVLGKETHQISLDKGVLKMTVRLPSDGKQKQGDSTDKDTKKSDHAGTNKQSTVQDPKPVDGQTGAKGKNGDSDDEEQCSKSAVLGNVPDSFTSEILDIILESILKDLSSPTASQDYNLELIPDISSAVVTFQSGKDNTEFIERCQQNRTFKKKNLSVLPLETTRQVMVDGVSGCNEEFMSLYFESKGGEVEDVQLNEAEQSAVITFKKHQDVKKVLGKKYEIKNEEVKVYPFYKSLGVPLYGKDKPSPKLPAAISESIDNTVLRYLANYKAALETIGRDLEKHFCNITLEQSAVHLSASPSLLKQKDAKVIIKEWANTVKAAFSQAVSKFKAIKFSLQSEAWEESEQKIKEKLQKEDVVVVSDKTSGVLSVAGLENDVNRLEKPISEVLDRIKERVRREKLSKTQEINVSPSMFHILSQDGLQDKLLQVYPELKLSYDQKKKTLKVTGFVDEIINATQVISNATLGLKRQNLEVDEFLLDMLKDEQQEEATDAFLTAYGIKAALEISPQRVQLVAVSDKDLMIAQDHLNQILKSQYINVEDLEVLKKPEWQQLVLQQKKANSVSGMRVQIITHQQQVVVSGHKDSVDKVSSELEDFLTENAQVNECVAVKANIIIDYLKSQTTLLKQLEGVEVSFGKEEIILSGCRSAVKDCKTTVKDLLSSVCFDSFKVTKPGVKKFFKERESFFASLIKNDADCMVQLADNSNEEDDFALVQVQRPIYKVQTSDGVDIVVSKADMCSYSVDAVVNPSTEDLKHTSGLALALSKAAGPQLQAECDQIFNVKGKLRPGDCVVTDAGGMLRCKKVIHAVGPYFDQANPKKAEAQLKKTVKESLEQAEKFGCVSVAIPAISRTFDFPLNLCLATIARAVKEYCDEKYDDNTLKMIHLVDNEDGVALGLESAVKQEFGSHGVSVSSQNLKPKVSSKPPLIKLGLPDPSLCRGQTKEGLSIVLKKGHIEAAKTDVIVNTVAEDLVLDTGAISKAIFNAAGAKLQQLVYSQKTSGSPGDIVFTDGCKLKSKQVFHVIAPSWDNGQGSAEKTLLGIFKDCLDLAEKTRLTSISFPAVGTGNLGFPKYLVASLMLDAFLDFSSQRQSNHLQKIAIVLYPGDAETIQVFTDEFKKKFPSTTGPSGTASGPVDSSHSTSGKFSKVVSSSGMHETKLGNVTIQVEAGDITKETTDVIVNSSNDKFTLNTGVSKAILDAAGKAVLERCQYLGSKPHQGMIMTVPGNLKCKKILHLVGQTDPVKIYKNVKEALQMCVKNSYTSVSFPALGTGEGKAQAKVVADTMMDAMIDVFSQNTSSSLTLIRIIIFQQSMLKDFHSSMQEREATEPKEKGGLWSRFKSFIMPQSAEKQQGNEVFAIETMEVEPTVFHICGASQAKVDAAKQKINDLISGEQFSIEITDNNILNLSTANCQRIVDIQMKMDVRIKKQITNGQPSFIIEGLSRDVLQANQEILNMMQKVRGEQELKRKYELTATVVDWQYQRPGLQYQSFDQMTNYELEHALERAAPTLKITINGSDYTVQMKTESATDGKGNILQIRRLDKLKGDDVPELWDDMPAGKTCLSVPIQAASSEYAEVIKLFKATCNQTVVKIERIQNPALWKSLQIKKHEMELRNNHQNNEKRLFHGTSEDTVPIINESGFNRSYAGKNAAYFGNGSYFAIDAGYSAQDTYSKPNAKGEKFMYLCRVLTGDYTLGQKDMIAPPSKGSGVHMYDSVVDDMTTPSMFVVFHDIQAYPEYLITFK